LDESIKFKGIYVMKSVISFKLVSAVFVLTAFMPRLSAEVRLKATVQKDAQDVSAYYFTPEGLTFSGPDKDGNFDGDYGLAPVGKWLVTKAECKGGEYEWSFPTGLDGNGNEKIRYSTQQELQFRMAEKGLFSAPALTVTSASGSVTFRVADDGIRYGEIGTPEHYAVNFRKAETLGFDTANEVLTANSSAADNMMNMIMAGTVFSDIRLYGFAESFYYGSDFWLQGVAAEICCDTPPGKDDIAVKVYPKIRTSVQPTEVGAFTVADVHPSGENRYYVTFAIDEPVLVNTGLQVVVVAPEGKETNFAPVIPVMNSYHASNAGTASLYADFKIMGQQVYKQYIDFYGTQIEDENDGSISYLNHWNIGVLGSYSRPASVDVPASDELPDASVGVYSVAGVRVGTHNDIGKLPPGIYITGGRKIAVTGTR